MLQVLVRIPIPWLQAALLGLIVLFALAALVGRVLDRTSAAWGCATWVGGLVILHYVRTNLRSQGIDESIPIFGFGSFLFLAFIASSWLARRLARREGLDPERLMDLALWIFLGGIVGARVLFLVRNPDQFKHPLDFFKIWQGGIVFYGGVVAAIGVFVFYTRRFKLPAMQVLDVLAPAIALGIGIGRFGCLMNGCCWGEVSLKLPVAVRFPFGSIPYMHQLEHDQVSLGFSLWTAGDGAALRRAGSDPIVRSVEAASWAADIGLKPRDRIERVNGRAAERVEAGQAWRDVPAVVGLLQQLAPGSDVTLEVLRGDKLVRLAGVFRPDPPRSRPVHATQVYLALAGWLLLAATMVHYRHRRRHGEVMVVLMVGYAITRFIIEFFRADEPKWADGLTISQNVSIAVLAGAAALGFWLRRPTNAAAIGSVDLPIARSQG
jgi:phosphatidylglycerol:prolipoprotein diacylglycerol transferase